MSKSFFKKYITILNEAVMLRSLQDAGPDYSEGDTQIWYWKEQYSHLMMRGYDYLKEKGRLPNPKALQMTHVLLGKIAEKNLEKIYSLMQGEAWSPQGQGRELVQKLGVGHTSMSVGDIVVIGKRVLMVDTQNFADIVTGEKNVMLLNDIFGESTEFKNNNEVGDRVNTPLGSGTIVKISAPADGVRGRMLVKLDDPSTAGPDGLKKDTFAFNSSDITPLVEDDRPNDNFGPDDIKKLERTDNINDARKMAIELISMASKRSMKPQKVAWFKNAVNSKKTVLDIVKLMYDLLLSGEGNKVIGGRHSMEPNSYRKAFGENEEDGAIDTGTEIYTPENPTDMISMDVPLFLRMLEFAKEDAVNDMSLHDVAERAVELMHDNEHLSMKNYNEIVGGQTPAPNVDERLSSQDTMKKWIKTVDETKKKGADGKACWDGYRYNGTKDGKDSCVKVKK